MKRPKNKSKTKLSFEVGYWVSVEGEDTTFSEIAYGATEESAKKAAIRRLERLIRELEK